MKIDSVGSYLFGENRLELTISDDLSNRVFFLK